jgi:hypothetical protein
MERFQPLSMMVAGALFGAGWWVWGDAVVVNAVNGTQFLPLSLAPGLVATLAVIVMQCVPRSDLSEYDDDAMLVRCACVWTWGACVWTCAVLRMAVEPNAHV